MTPGELPVVVIPEGMKQVGWVRDDGAVVQLSYHFADRGRPVFAVVPDE